MEFRAISKIVISASSAPSSGGVRRENPFGPLRCRSRACSKGFGQALQLLCKCRTSPRALGLESQQSEFDHIQTCSVTMARFCIKGRIQQNPTPCGTAPVLTTCPQVPESRSRLLWSEQDTHPALSVGQPRSPGWKSSPESCDIQMSPTHLHRHLLGIYLGQPATSILCCP